MSIVFILVVAAIEMLYYFIAFFPAKRVYKVKGRTGIWLFLSLLIFMAIFLSLNFITVYVWASKMQFSR
ncbi:MAG: hypothetical protein GC180_04315 [Bacteroidetes bacterium]|nr:hypothetical protein [Bacteroidota bacterium]